MLFTLLALAAALRVYGLGSIAPIEDEYFQFYSALQPPGLLSFLQLIRENPHHVLLDPLGTFLMGRVSDSPFWLRLPSALYGTAAVAVLWRLERHFEDPWVPRLAAFLLAVSLPALEWSRRADFYALLVLLSVGATGAFFDTRQRPASWKGLALWNTAFLFGHPYAVFTCALQATSLRTKSHAASWAKSWVAAGVVFLPWWVWSFGRLANTELFDFRMMPGDLGLSFFLRGIPQALSQQAGEGPLQGFGESFAALAALLYSVGWAISFASVLRGKGGPLIRFAHLALPLGVAGVVVADLAYDYFFAYRQLHWLLPFWTMAAADGLLKLADVAAARYRRIARVTPAVLAAAFFLPLYAAQTEAGQTEARGLVSMVQRLDQHADPGDCFLFSSGDLAQEFLFTYDREAFRLSPGWSLRAGHLTFVMPEVLAARGGREIRIMDLPKEHVDQDTRPWRCWLFSGRIDDLYVRPPRRPPARGGS